MDTGDRYEDLHVSLHLPDYSLDYDTSYGECSADPPGIHSVLFPQGEGFWMTLYNEPMFDDSELMSSQTVDVNNPTWTSCNDFYSPYLYCSGAMASSLKFG